MIPIKTSHISRVCRWPVVFGIVVGWMGSVGVPWLGATGNDSAGKSVGTIRDLVCAGDANPVHELASTAVCDEPAGKTKGSAQQEAQERAGAVGNGKPEKAQTQPTAGKANAAATKAKEPKEKEPSRFIRLRVDEASGEPTALDTAIVSYKLQYKGKPVRVDLVGVVHIGEKSYYEELNRTLAKYDSVLYELVAPKGTRIPRGGRKTKSNHPVSVLQRGMKNVLELEFQLEQVDYTKDNFVHADLTPTEFAQSMKDRNESFLKMMIRAWKLSMEQQLDPDNDQRMPSDLDLLRALFSKHRALRMKRLMAGQLANMEGQLDIFGGPEGSTLITERNKRALAVLREELDKGKRRIAIFYGAGHLPDFDERLVKDFQAKRGETRWLTAWKMEEPAKPKPKPGLEQKDGKVAPVGSNG